MDYTFTIRGLGMAGKELTRSGLRKVLDSLGQDGEALLADVESSTTSAFGDSIVLSGRYWAEKHPDSGAADVRVSVDRTALKYALSKTARELEPAFETRSNIRVFTGVAPAHLMRS